jgi:hypothetical protein
MWTAVVACLLVAALCLGAVLYLDAVDTDALNVRELAYRGVFASVLLALAIGSTGALIAVLRPAAADGEGESDAEHVDRIRSEAARRAARDALGQRLRESAQLMNVRLEGADEVRLWRARVQTWFDGTYGQLREQVSSQAAERFSRAPARPRRFVRAANAEHSEWLAKLHGWRDQLGQITRRL